MLLCVWSIFGNKRVETPVMKTPLRAREIGPRMCVQCMHICIYFEVYETPATPVRPYERACSVYSDGAAHRRQRLELGID